MQPMGYTVKNHEHAKNIEKRRQSYLHLGMGALNK
jgi:hypothetical protein